MSAKKHIPEGIEVPDGWVCEVHTRRCDAVVWFSPSVTGVFTGYESRHELVNAVADEIRHPNKGFELFKVHVSL